MTLLTALHWCIDILGVLCLCSSAGVLALVAYGAYIESRREGGQW